MMSDRIHRVLSHRELSLYVAVVAVLLCLPSLWLGLQTDDHVLCLELMDDPPDSGWSRSPAETFAFLSGDEAHVRGLVGAGLIPWWTHENLRLAFFRPLTGWTHWVDFRLWLDRSHAGR